MCISKIHSCHCMFCDYKNSDTRMEARKNICEIYEEKILGITKVSKKLKPGSVVQKTATMKHSSI